MNNYIIEADSEEKAIELAKAHFGCSEENIKLTMVKNGLRVMGKTVKPYTFEASVINGADTNGASAGSASESGQNDGSVSENAQEGPQENNQPASEQTAAEVNADGSFSIEYTEEGVKLLLKFASGNGKNVKMDDIISELDGRLVKDYDASAVREAVRFHKESQIIAPQQEEVHIDEDVKIKADKLGFNAYMIFVQPHGGRLLTEEEINGRIAEAGIVYGLKKDDIKKAIEERAYEKEYHIAVCTPSVNGTDGKVKYKIDTETESKPVIGDDGRVNYYDIDNFTTVKAGDRIAKYIKPTKGVNGTNVYGNPISASDGKDIKLPIGKNVELSEDGVSILSSADGLLEIKRGIISVDKVLNIAGDVDLTVGNIDFPGAVRIGGDVKSGMSVKAEGEITIRGSVEAANITAGEDITVNGGVQGMSKTVITAGGTVKAKYIENAEVFAEGKIITGSSLQSNLESYDSIEVTSGRGCIVGGRVKALNCIKCNSFGSASNMPTAAEVGIMPKIKKEMSDLEQELNALKKEIAGLEMACKVPDYLLSDEKKAIKEKLVAEKDRKVEEASALSEKIAEINKAAVYNQQAYLCARDYIYEGAAVTVCREFMNVTNRLKYTRLQLGEDGIAITEYR